jgi:Uma2 family endonuclease
MASNLPIGLLRYAFAKAANDYLRSLPLEHFMESTPQARQREITLESFDLVHARRHDVQIFNELLVQFPTRGHRRPVQVVPDNMVVVWKETIQAVGSYDVPFQPVLPFWVFDYISLTNHRKDYEDNFEAYDRCKVPYALIFYPDSQELTLFHHNGKEYVSIEPNTRGCLAVPELDMEVALLDGWVRYWYQSELLPLPADLQRDLDEALRRADAERQGRLAAEQEVVRLRAELERLRSLRNGGAT